MPARRPAIFPLLPRLTLELAGGQAAHVSCCVIVAGGQLHVVLRDVYQAAGMDLEAADLAQEPDCEGKNFAAHEGATAVGADAAVALLTGAAETSGRDRPALVAAWLRERVAYIVDDYGLNLLEHRPNSAPDLVVEQERRIPEWWSVRAAAALLDRDPTIQIGAQRLFEEMHRRAWIVRGARGAWQPAPGICDIGLLTVQDIEVRQYSTDEPYPQILITVMGLRELHRLLGGTAELTLTAPTHLTLITGH